jgi:hypothetical protein
MNESLKIALLVIGGLLVLISSGPAGAPGVPAAERVGGTAFLLIVGAVLVLLGAARPHDPEPVPFVPVALTAELDEPLSRGLWLVKWLLAIPHLVILAFLGVAFIVISVAAFVAIVVTGRYPPAFFATNVGILRWHWRVGWYAFALGTDRYPPFSLRDQIYPARLEIAYPAELSRGLVWVKWLLALPHYVIVAIFTGSAEGSGPHVPGLLPALVFFAAIALLFTGRYPSGIFDLVVGLQRWLIRVVAYVALLRDEYPPFRLDQGGASGSP